MPRALLRYFWLPAILVLQGCVPVASGVIAYESAISAQEHAAYTDYLFAQQAKNRSLVEAGEKPLFIIPEKRWRNEIYRPRLEYARYYTRQTSSNAPVHSFEDWKAIDWPLEKAKSGAPIKRRGE